jgi:hypothetical protein
LQSEAACNRICDNIMRLLFELPPPASRAVFAAACATQDLAAALHRASGLPGDRLWYDAFESLEHFLDLFTETPKLNGSPALAELRDFAAENSDLSARLQFKRAS